MNPNRSKYVVNDLEWIRVFQSEPARLNRYQRIRYESGSCSSSIDVVDNESTNLLWIRELALNPWLGKLIYVDSNNTGMPYTYHVCVHVFMCKIISDMYYYDLKIILRTDVFMTKWHKSNHHDCFESRGLIWIVVIKLNHCDLRWYRVIEALSSGALFLYT
jgi:hypothetical protein